MKLLTSTFALLEQGLPFSTWHMSHFGEHWKIGAIGCRGRPGMPAPARYSDCSQAPASSEKMPASAAGYFQVGCAIAQQKLRHLQFWRAAHGLATLLGLTSSMPMSSPWPQARLNEHGRLWLQPCSSLGSGPGKRRDRRGARRRGAARGSSLPHQSRACKRQCH